MKPDLSKPLIPLELLPEEDRAQFGRKAKGLKGIAQFIKVCIHKYSDILYYEHIHLKKSIYFITVTINKRREEQPKNYLQRFQIMRI